MERKNLIKQCDEIIKKIEDNKNKELNEKFDEFAREIQRQSQKHILGFTIREGLSKNECEDITKRILHRDNMRDFGPLTPDVYDMRFDYHITRDHYNLVIKRFKDIKDILMYNNDEITNNDIIESLLTYIENNLCMKIKELEKN